MDDVKKAAEALFLRHTTADLAFEETRELVVRVVLDAVGYDTLRTERNRYASLAESVASGHLAPDEAVRCARRAIEDSSRAALEAKEDS